MTRNWKPSQNIPELEFSYNLTRPYPYRRVKWFIVIVMTLILVGFSVFNLATIGYDLQPTATLDPNTTESKRWWFNNKIFTWGDDKLSPKCNDLEIAIGDQFLTSNLGAKWTVNSISGLCSNATPDRPTSCPSVAYHANYLQNCYVDSVTLNLEKVDDTSPGPNAYWFSWADSNADVAAQCDIINEQGFYTIFISSHYNAGTKVFDYLAVDDYNRSTSLWWGARLMDNYFTGTRAMLARGSDNLTAGNGARSSRGRLVFIRNDNATNDIRGLSLMRLDSYYFFGQDGGVINPGNDKLPTPDSYFNNPAFIHGRDITEGFFFSKVLYSEALVDLGVNLTRSANLLLDEQSLRYALNPTDDLNRQPGQPLYSNQTYHPFDWWRMNGIAPPGVNPAIDRNSVLMSSAYDNTTLFPRRPLGTNPATIYSQYTCSIPTAKGTSTIVMQVIIADFVVMQVAWVILTWLADKYVSMKDETAMYCRGCKLLQDREDEVALLAIKGINPSSVASDSPALSSSSVASANKDRLKRKPVPQGRYHQIETSDSQINMV